MMTNLDRMLAALRDRPPAPSLDYLEPRVWERIEGGAVAAPARTAWPH
jgi:hypothetical protein